MLSNAGRGPGQTMGRGPDQPRRHATWRNAYLSAAQELRDGVPSGTKNPRSLRDVTKGMSVLLALNALSVRLNGSKAVGSGFVINWNVSDTGEACHSELTNAVLINRDGTDPQADATVELVPALPARPARSPTSRRCWITSRHGFRWRPTG